MKIKSLNIMLETNQPLYYNFNPSRYPWHNALVLAQSNKTCIFFYKIKKN